MMSVAPVQVNRDLRNGLPGEREIEISFPMMSKIGDAIYVVVIKRHKVPLSNNTPPKHRHRPSFKD